MKEVETESCVSSYNTDSSNDDEVQEREMEAVKVKKDNDANKRKNHYIMLKKAEKHAVIVDNVPDLAASMEQIARNRQKHQEEESEQQEILKKERKKRENASSNRLSIVRELPSTSISSPILSKTKKQDTSTRKTKKCTISNTKTKNRSSFATINEGARIKR